MTSTVVLNMIVRNEAPIIRAFLEQVRPFIDAWAIMDTGSTDTTVEIIKRELCDLPGRIEQMEWAGFANSRNAAIEIARDLGDYLLFLDADDKACWQGDPSEIKAQLTETLHHGTLMQGNSQYNRLIFMKNGAQSRYRGVIHEVLIPTSPDQIGPLIEGFHIERGAIGIGNRSVNGAAKYREDARLLENALREGTDDDLTERYQFYLAQSYRDYGEKDKATENYRLRLAMPGGYQQERYVSALNIAALLDNTEENLAEKMLVLLQAREIDPHRAEAYHRIAELARSNHMWQLAYENAVRARDTHTPPDRLFIDRSVDAWRAMFEVSVAAWHVGEFDEGRRACTFLLTSSRTPEHIRDLTEKNMNYYKS